VTSFATAAAARASELVVAFQLEGDGTSAGLRVYCSEVPTFAVGNALYRNWIREWPTLLSEQVDPEGGVPEAASFQVSVLDYGDAFTATWGKVDAEPTTHLDGAIAVGDLTIDVDDASAFSANDIIYVGAEAMTISGISSNELTVTRASLDTTAYLAADGAAVFAAPQFLMGRRLRLFAIPTDAGSWSDAYELGVYHVDALAFSPDFHSYEISARSQAKYLSRVASTNALTAYQVKEINGFGNLRVDPISTGPSVLWSVLGNVWNDNEAWMKVEDEVIRVDPRTITPDILGRAELGTKHGGDIDGLGHWVYGADPTGPCAFRWHPFDTAYDAATYARASHAWEKSAHAADIILCLLTSSAHADDGFEIGNGFTAAVGDPACWSSLPVGYGIGVPAARIDLPSFLRFRQDNPDALFPFFHFGDEPVPFSELITDNFLRPLGAFLTTEGGTIKIKQPRFPKKGETTTAWGDDDLLATYADGVMVPDLSARKDAGSQYTSVTFVLRSDGGEDIRTTLSAGDVIGWSTPSSHYASEARTLTIDVPSVRAGGAGDALADEYASRKLWRLYRPRWVLGVRVGIDQYARGPGDLIAVTFADLPDEAAGTRGWTAVKCELTERAFSISPDHVGMTAELYSWGPGLNAGWVAPSAYATGVSGPDGDGDYAIGTYANLYTDASAVGDMASDDASAFAVGDKVMLLNPDGSVASAANQTVTTVAAGQLDVDGNWSGTLAAGLIVAYDDGANAASQQTDDFVYWTESPIWRFGDL